MFSHISALLKLSMSIFLICGAALLYRDASNTGIRVVSTASGTETLVGNGSSAVDNGAGGFLLVGMTFFFIATMIDMCRDCKLGLKHSVANIVALFGIFFSWIGSILLFPELSARNHHNADSTMWIMGAFLLILAQVIAFVDNYFARDPRPSSSKFTSIGLVVLGSLLIFIGGILMIGDEWSSWDFFLWALSGSIDKEDEYESAIADQEDRVKGAECFIAGTVFYLMHGILEVVRVMFFGEM